MSQYKRTSTQRGPKPYPATELVPSDYRRDAEKLREMFPSWTAADLASVLAEVGGDVSTAVTRITEGHAEQWGTATRKKDKKTHSRDKVTPVGAAGGRREGDTWRGFAGHGGFLRGGIGGRGGFRGGSVKTRDSHGSYSGITDWDAWGADDFSLADSDSVTDDPWRTTLFGPAAATTSSPTASEKEVAVPYPASTSVQQQDTTSKPTAKRGAAKLSWAQIARPNNRKPDPVLPPPPPAPPFEPPAASGLSQSTSWDDIVPAPDEATTVSALSWHEPTLPVPTTEHLSVVDYSESWTEADPASASPIRTEPAKGVTSGLERSAFAAAPASIQQRSSARSRAITGNSPRTTPHSPYHVDTALQKIDVQLESLGLSGEEPELNPAPPEGYGRPEQLTLPTPIPITSDPVAPAMASITEPIIAPQPPMHISTTPPRPTSFPSTVSAHIYQTTHQAFQEPFQQSLQQQQLAQHIQQQRQQQSIQHQRMMQQQQRYGQYLASPIYGPQEPQPRILDGFSSQSDASDLRSRYDAREDGFVRPFELARPQYAIQQGANPTDPPSRNLLPLPQNAYDSRPGHVMQGVGVGGGEGIGRMSGVSMQPQQNAYPTPGYYYPSAVPYAALTTFNSHPGGQETDTGRSPGLEFDLWRDAHPDLALALLSDEEADALASIARKATTATDQSVPINMSLDMVTYEGSTLGTRLIGNVHPHQRAVCCQTLVYIRQAARPALQIKGPKLEGSIENNGVRVQGANVEIMLKIGFLDKPHSQKIILHMLV